MTIKELSQKYNFHDSCITKIEYDNTQKVLSIIMDFCNWAQESYVSTDPELLCLKLMLEDVSDYTGPVGEIDYFSIGNSEIRDNKYYLFFEDDINSEIYEFYLTPSSATVDILGPVESN